MIITKVSPNSLIEAYNIRCQAMDAEHSASLPFHIVWCEIEPKGRTLCHSHHEVEAFFIVAGTAMMQINDESAPVSGGSLIRIPSGAEHQIRNLSDKNNVTFLSIYADRIHTDQITQIFSPPPTPNGALHLGHISGPYLSADVLQRALKARQHQAIHVTGTDDFQPYIEAIARSEEKPARDIAKQYRKKILKGFELAHIDIDECYHPLNNQRHQQGCRDFFQLLLENAVIVQSEVSFLFCQHCQDFLDEASVRGECALCQQSTSGGTCESCGQHAFIHGELINPRCLRCNKAAVIPKTSLEWVFPLAVYRRALQSYLNTTVMAKKTLSLAQRLLNLATADYPITRPSHWGIQLTPEDSSQRFDVWFEMAANYFYRSECATNNIYTFGFDNSFYYTLLIPAFFIALNRPQGLASTLVSNDFYLLDGQKFSTSRQHALWVNDMFDNYHCDVLRFYLAKTRSESQQQSFSLASFHRFIDETIDHRLNPWIAELNQTIIEGNGDDSAVTINKGFETQLLTLAYQIQCCYTVNQFSLNQVAADLCEWLNIAFAPRRTKGALSQELAIFRLFILLAQPIMPQFTRQCIEALELNTSWDIHLKPLRCDPKTRLPALKSHSNSEVK